MAFLIVLLLAVQAAAQPKGEAERARMPIPDIKLLGVDGAQALLDDPELLKAAKALKKGEVILRDLDRDGKPDAMIYRDDTAIVVALDDNHDMTWEDKAPDGRDDCLAVDLFGDGRLDRSIDCIDGDRNGVADVMVQTYVTGSQWGRRALVVVVDYDQRGPKRLWSLTRNYGYLQGQCQWKCDFGGNGYFALFARDTSANQWVGNWENPFCFYDPDGDGLPEEAVRVSGRGRRLRSVRYGVNADSDATEGEDYDYDFSVTALGQVEPEAEAFTRFTLRTGEQTGEYLKWERARAVARRLPWSRSLLVWDENDHNVAFRGEEKERWEGVINSSYRGFPQEGGPPCGSVNKRYELDPDLTGKMRLYYWPADRRIHLLGAEAGTLTVDYDYDGKTGMEIEYRDDDGDGFLDCREVTTRSPAQKRIVEKGSAPSQTIALDYGEISAIWPGALKETVAAQEDLLKALSTILGRPSLVGGPVDFYENATEKQFRAAGRMRQSVEARRYYQDVEIELIFAALLEKYPEPRKGLSITRAILERARRLADQGSLREAAGLLKKSGP